MANFFERQIMRDLVAELTRRDSKHDWDLYPGPEGSLAAGALRTVPPDDDHLLAITMDPVGRWVMLVIYGEDDDRDRIVDLGLKRGVMNGAVAEQVLKIIEAADRAADTANSAGLDGPAEPSSPARSGARNAQWSERPTSWVVTPAKSFQTWTLAGAIPALFAFPISFDLVIGGFLGLVAHTVSLIVWLRTDWTNKTGLWVAVTSTIVGAFLVTSHLTFLWNVIN